MSTWYGDVPPPVMRLDALGWVRAGLRGALLCLLCFGGLAVVLVVRVVERSIAGHRRPWTARIAHGVCRLALPVLGVRLSRSGQPMRHPGAIVANHTSWLDIFVLNACAPVHFVAKAEVASWPGIGWLARAAGTVFIRRDARDARAQQLALEERIRLGQRLVFFPEGTSSDGQRVLPFKSTLFQAFFADGLAEVMWLQPVTVVYQAPPGTDPRFFGWWGDMAFGPNLARVLGCRGGAVRVVFHAPLRVRDFASRKDLAQACEAAVRGAMDQALSR